MRHISRNPFSSSTIYGLIIALGAILADQYTKTCLLEKMQQLHGTLPITSFFNIVLVWNRGMSFGMFNRAEPVNPWWLIAIALVLAGFVFTWLRRATDRWSVIGCGLIIGGALGNVIDRLRLGAVVDFLDFHLGTHHWPAFNIADSAICIGAGLLLYVSLTAPKIKPNETNS